MSKMLIREYTLSSLRLVVQSFAYKIRIKVKKEDKGVIL